MNRGAWHQCGDKSQKIVQEQLGQGIGAGAIISPRDLARAKAIEYAEQYRNLGAEVLLDQQFHIPEYTNTNLGSYPISRHRAAISQLQQISDASLDLLAADLEETNRELGVSALIAPAVMYEAARNDIVRLNQRMYSAARRAGNALGVPTYATVVLGRSVTASMQTLSPVLSQVTALAADGWYFAFEFDAERIPSDQDAIERVGRTLLTLACTGRPVLHAYAGPMSMLSLGFGATAAGIGHAQNVWRFSPERWQATTGQGGGGDAPPRFFSSTLWGTIVYPDETVRLPANIASQVLTQSPYSAGVGQNPPPTWSRWDSYKHLVYLIGQTVGQLAQLNDARACARRAVDILTNAVELHGDILGAGLQLGDGTNRYQANWQAGVEALLIARSEDYDYIDLIS